MFETNFTARFSSGSLRTKFNSIPSTEASQFEILKFTKFNLETIQQFEINSFEMNSLGIRLQSRVIASISRQKPQSS